MYEKLVKAAGHIQEKIQDAPEVGIVLGSGLGAFIDKVENPIIIPYSEIPYFHETTVEGHEGRLIIGKVGSVTVALLQGRLHAYEGLPAEEIVFPIRLLSTLGIHSVILTNASGGINESFNAGDLVLIKDHINMSGVNPLVGPNIKELGPRFPDMSKAYDPNLIELFESVGKDQGIEVKQGVYMSVLGPTYETPAEVKMLRILGGDMVGMSTVPESIAANHLGLKVAGVSCITNMAAGIENVALNHDDVKAEAKKVMEKFSQLLVSVLERFKEFNAS